MSAKVDQLVGGARVRGRPVRDGAAFALGPVVETWSKLWVCAIAVGLTACSEGEESGVGGKGGASGAGGSGAGGTGAGARGGSAGSGAVGGSAGAASGGTSGASGSGTGGSSAGGVGGSGGSSGSSGSGGSSGTTPDGGSGAGGVGGAGGASTDGGGMLCPGAGWCQLSNTQLRDVCPAADKYPAIQANEGCSGVINDWNGGMADTKRNRLLIWGGGHGGYFGNEIYALDLNTLKMLRLNEPSNVSGYDFKDCYAPDQYPDGRPTSRHTYDALSYVAHTDQLWTFSGAKAPCGYSGRDTWTLNLASVETTPLGGAAPWTLKKAAPAGPQGVPGVVSDYDPNSKLVILSDLAESLQLRRRGRPVHQAQLQRDDGLPPDGPGRSETKPVHRRRARGRFWCSTSARGRTTTSRTGRHRSPVAAA